jgi:hypothetical protein
MVSNTVYEELSTFIMIVWFHNKVMTEKYINVYMNIHIYVYIRVYIRVYTFIS